MASASAAPVAGSLRRRLGLVTGIGVAVVALDVATKTLAVAVFATAPVRLLSGRLVLNESRNPGAAFGLAPSATPLLALIAAAAVVAVLIIARRPHTAAAALVLGLVLGGAAGNLIDRLFREPAVLRGHVVDWIDFGWWPSFNLADASISTAAVLAVVLSLRRPSPGTDA